MQERESGRAKRAAERPRLDIVYRDPKTLRAYERNARTHSPAQVRQIRDSMEAFGFTNPILLKEDGITIGAGHGRQAAALLDPPLAEVPTIILPGLDERQWRAYVIADNKLALNAGWDEDLLRLEVSELLECDIGADLLGFDEREIKALLAEPVIDTSARSGALKQRFLVAPFSVLSARGGWWQDRKRAWLGLGIKSELGRTEDVLFAKKSQAQLQDLKARGQAVARSGLPAGRTFGQIENFDGAGRNISGTSIFDPVLCELAYRWFSPPDGVVLDPFAGGSVRGVVAGYLDRHYHGIDLRAEQVEANEQQAAAILAARGVMPVWRCGDSLQELDAPDTPDADFVFSCPPYADLEVYSDDVRDLSTMDYADFLGAYRSIIAKACARLKPDRFACFVVGEVRDGAGIYRDFVGDTVQAFRDAGLGFYNEAILVTAAGSLPIRAGKQFAAGRKLGKTHQNILVFVKGDPRKATEACGDVEVGDVGAEDLAEAA